MGITTQVRPENYFEFITRIMFWIGICFEMPLMIMFLAKLKFVTAKQLAAGMALCNCCDGNRRRGGHPDG